MVAMFQPGDEVRLKGGATGVLFARTRNVAARRNQEGWFFLPDRSAASGLMVMSQPRTIDEGDIECKTGRRPGRWPTDYLTDPIDRQRVYVAYMQGQALPELRGGRASTDVRSEDPERGAN